MRVTDRMRRPAGALDPRDTVSRAARLLGHQQNGDGIPVVSESTLLGVLDKRHVARARPSAATTLTVGEIEGRLSQVAVGRILPPHFAAVGARTPLNESVRLMRAGHLSVLPVTRGEELIGVLTENALLDLLVEMLADRSDAAQPEERGP